MMIKEVDSKIQDFADVESICPRDIIKKRVAGLLGKDYEKGIFLDKRQILRPKHRICQNTECVSSNVKFNGYRESESFIVKQLNLTIKVGQCECNDCGHRWSVDVGDMHQLFETFKDMVRDFASEIRAEKNSLYCTAGLIGTLIGKRYSHMSIDRWFKARTQVLQENKVSSCSGYYFYDEQEVRAAGKTIQRLVLRDAKTSQLIAEEIKDDKKKDTIKEFLSRNLENKPKIAMIVDGDSSYPDIITHDLKMSYQLDIRHLFDNIRKTFKDECAYGVGHKKLHMADELKKQELYDVFYPRKELIFFIKNGLKKLDMIKDRSLKEETDDKLQKELMSLKKERRKKRRRKDFVHEHKNYSLIEASKKLDSVKILKNYYPKDVKKTIDNIAKDWDHYALFLKDTNVPPTSNGIEQYFSSTLRRSEKKKFRTLDSLLDFLRIQRIKNSNNFLDIISILGMNFMQILRMFMEIFLII